MPTVKPDAPAPGAKTMDAAPDSGRAARERPDMPPGAGSYAFDKDKWEWVTVQPSTEARAYGPPDAKQGS